MFRRKFLGLVLTGCSFACTTVTAWSQDNWGTKMFDRLNVDFGGVAKGAEVTERVKVRNVYKEAIQVSASTSCSCFRASVVDNLTTIPSGQTAEIELTVNTVNYQKERTATMTVHLYEPTHGWTTDVRVPLKAYIRVDVVCTPGSVNFGTVELGKGAEQVIKVAYAGRPNWQIREVRANNPQMMTEIKEVGRANGYVNYELKVAVKPDTPVGQINDQVILITDDDINQQVPLMVHGLVEADITVTPVLEFGSLTPGQTVTKMLLVRARKPIVIEKIEREKEDNSFSVRLPNDARPVHTLPITLVTPSESGEFNELFTVKIAGRAEPVTFRAQGKISVPESTSTN